jgi:nitroreductase/dihydropteridine reductase
MNAVEAMQWRYAVKAMNGGKVSDDKIERILEAIRLSPSSSGLQPYELLVVTNSELKTQLKAAAYNQGQVEDCSHLLVFAAWDTYTEDRINKWFDLVNEVRGVKSEGWENYRNSLLKSYPPRPAEVNFEHASKQVYIALGIAMLAAAMEEVDATPMEGFIPAEVDRILGLESKGLKSVLLLPLGYRNPEKDYLINAKKVRKSMNDFVHEIK